MHRMFTDIPSERERHSGGLPNILTAAHSRQGEGGRRGGREQRRYKERESEKTSISSAAFDFIFNPTLDHLTLYPSGTELGCDGWYFLSFFFCKTIHTCGGDALRGNIFHYIRTPEAWRLTDMARGIESLVSLNPFCSMDSAQGGHNDNCKFWLLDLGRCLDDVFHMRNWIMCRAGYIFFPLPPPVV